jgi:hypothetical protein
VCSFNGSFQARPPSGKLKYAGGEARIISVDRSIGLSKLRSKISDLFPATRHPSYSLKYQLPHRSCEDSPLLVSVASDDDVRCMIDEYDKLELYGKHARLWLFVCTNDNDDDNANAMVKNDGNLPVNCVKSESLCTKNGVACVNRASRREAQNGQFDCKLAKNLEKYGDDSLRKIVLKQQLLAKQSVCNGGDAKEEQRNVELAPMSRLNRENIMPSDGNCHSCNDNFVGSGYRLRYSCTGERIWGGLHCGTRRHRFSVNDARNQRISSCHARNYLNNPFEMGSHRTVRLDGRVLVGKFCHGLRPNSNISKQSQSMRVCHPNSNKIPYQCDLEKVQLQKGINISRMSDNMTFSNETEFGCNSEVSDEEAGSNGADNLQGGVASSVDFSLYNLSLSSSKEVGSPVLSSPATSNVADALLKPQTEEGQFAPDPSSKNAFKMEKDHVNEKEIQQDPPSGLSIDDKVLTKYMLFLFTGRF